MILAPSEQRALLRMERSLRRDPGVSAALRAFRCQCGRGTGAGEEGEEDVTPWHPVLWRAELLGLITLTLTFFAMIALLTCVAV